MPDLFAITYLNDQAEAFPNFNEKKMLQKLIKERLRVSVSWHPVRKAIQGKLESENFVTPL